ncbi:hypothetical protein RI367_005857 [Sorochytrium milnesiophthora]
MVNSSNSSRFPASSSRPVRGYLQRDGSQPAESVSNYGMELSAEFEALAVSPASPTHRPVVRQYMVDGVPHQLTIDRASADSAADQVGRLGTLDDDEDDDAYVDRVYSALMRQPESPRRRREPLRIDTSPDRLTEGPFVDLLASRMPSPSDLVTFEEALAGAPPGYRMYNVEESNRSAGSEYEFLLPAEERSLAATTAPVSDYDSGLQRMFIARQERAEALRAAMAIKPAEEDTTGCLDEFGNPVTDDDKTPTQQTHKRRMRRSMDSNSAQSSLDDRAPER